MKKKNIEKKIRDQLELGNRKKLTEILKKSKDQTIEKEKITGLRTVTQFF